MKKIISLVIALIAAFTLFACTPAAQPPAGDGATYTVTFKQDGVADVTRTVEEGKALTDIPVPQAVTGYTVAWENKDLSNVTSDMTVNAVKTPNAYKITFELNNDKASLQSTTLDVVYDAQVILPVPRVAGTKQFVKWVVKDTQTEFTDGVYTIAGNVTLTAVYDEWTENH